MIIGSISRLYKICWLLKIISYKILFTGDSKLDRIKLIVLNEILIGKI